jgi:hypothetical protein
MRKPYTPNKWNSTAIPRPPLASVPTSPGVEKTGTGGVELPAKSADTGTSHTAPADDDTRESKR